MTKALVIVDVQNDFCEGGSLAVAGGAAVAKRISTFLRDHRAGYTVVVATRDWHIEPGTHFAAYPDYVNTWPPHCVADTAGAAFHPGLDSAVVFAAEVDAIVSKGNYSAAYSGFEGMTDAGESLTDYLRARGITHLDIVGIATDYCDRATALEGRKAGFGVRLLLPLCAGVAPNTTVVALEEMAAAGVEICTSLDEAFVISAQEPIAGSGRASGGRY